MKKKYIILRERFSTKFCNHRNIANYSFVWLNKRKQKQNKSRKERNHIACVMTVGFSCIVTFYEERLDYLTKISCV